MLHDGVLVILVGEAPRQVFPVINNLKHVFQERSGKTDTNSLHRKPRDIHIQNNNDNGLIQADFLHHGRVCLHFRNLELGIDIITEAVSECMNDILHDPLIECHLDIRITIVAVRLHHRIRSAEHVTDQG